jgi:choloylglycine hydrolase
MASEGGSVNVSAGDAHPVPAPRSRGMRFRRALVVCLAIVTFGTALFLGAARDHIRSLWSLRPVPGTRMYVMDYYCGYNAAGLYEHGIDHDDIPGSLIRNYYPPLLAPICEVIGGHVKGQRKWHKGDHACSSVAVRDDEGHELFGRNFDWTHDPCLIVRIHGVDGPSSVSMVDLHYLQLGEDQLERPSLANRVRLLMAPYIPMDGMNDRGLAISCMTAEGSRVSPTDPGKPTLMVPALMRLVLDFAGTTDEAVAVMGRFNLDFDGVPCHFLVADRSGRSVVVEYVEGRVETVPSTGRWQVSTNHLLCGKSEGENDAACDRYRTAAAWLADTARPLDAGEIMRLMAAISAENRTMWTSVYNLTTGEYQVAHRRHYENLFSDRLALTKPSAGGAK